MEIVKVEKMAKLIKKSMDLKGSFEMSNLDASTIFNSVSYLSENFYVKEEEEKDTIYCFSNLFFTKGASKFTQIVTEKHAPESFGVMDEECIWLKIAERVVHKIKPVYVIQLNKN